MKLYGLHDSYLNIKKYTPLTSYFINVHNMRGALKGFPEYRWKNWLKKEWGQNSYPSGHDI